MASKWYTHVNQHTIRSNISLPPEDRQPPVRTQKGKSGKGTYAFEVELPEGSRVVYSAGEPILKCGARLVIVSDSEPKVIR